MPRGTGILPVGLSPNFNRRWCNPYRSRTCLFPISPLHFRRMPTRRHLLLALLALSFGALFAGCTSMTSADSTIPQARPADWEGGIPGMGTMPGSSSGGNGSH